MLRLLGSIVLLAALICPLPVGAEEGRDASGKKPRSPIVITSSSLSADRKANSALFEGSVVARSDEMTLMADRMKVYYLEAGELERIEAEGSVKMVREGRLLTSDSAVYNAATGRMTFTGNPRAIEGQNVLAGSSIVYIFDEDRFTVQDSRMVIEMKGAGK